MEHVFRLTLACPDRVGIVARVSNFLAQYNGTITEANQHADLQEGWFFLRNEIRADSLPFNIETFRQAFAPIADDLQMTWDVHDSQTRRKVVLLASKDNHCLADLLNRWHGGDLDCDIPCVIANHDHLRGLVEWHGIPFHHVPVDPANKAVHFDRVAELVEAAGADTLVLARYMQILPASFCARWPQRIINIHHSFLPSFIGARPYHQAFERGVKLIGATCHYVTDDLDAGPIIDQDVTRVSHRDDVSEMIRRGKDVERAVLARGLRWHLEDRVLVHGNKTVVFE
ncbi:formyltetrahydrofolate deformylase [Natronospirillum operosum]|uniref:Formyltetrahydrofolate deformylase n=1 Tax=Natronospirillum operosum TaxID=2759953 RepID=A0A4Z0WA91_9GAMM|nr:formyltetrahydrofolate deformylase [Natronospirillum operosum]TGG90217.1 formyltetrahydrofolate deformylase [Natronospirillum operosum]